MRLLVHELRNQQRLFWRNRELAFFTFMLPLILYVMLGSVQQDEQIEGVRGSEYLLAGMIGYGAAAIGFGALAMSLVYRREDGTLKRLRATPLPATTYIGAVLASILISFAITTVILFVLGALLFDVGRPHQIASVVALIVLGALAFAALGLAGAALVERHRRGGGAERHLPADDVPLRLVLLAQAFPSSCSGSAICCRSPTTSR